MPARKVQPEFDHEETEEKTRLKDIQPNNQTLLFKNKCQGQMRQKKTGLKEAKWTWQVDEMHDPELDTSLGKIAIKNIETIDEICVVG